jgi:hypothetical protein
VRVFWGTIGFVNCMVILPVVLTFFDVYGPFNWLLNATYSALQASYADDIIIATSLTVLGLVAKKFLAEARQTIMSHLRWASIRDTLRRTKPSVRHNLESPPQ